MSIKTTMSELTKERLTIRKTDPVKANVYLMLVNAVKQVTIDERRSETYEDFDKAAKKLYNETQQTILEYKKGNADTSELEAELKVLEPFLPQMLSKEQMTVEIKKVIDALPEDQRVIKNIMPKLKAIQGMDMKEAKPIIDSILAK